MGIMNQNKKSLQFLNFTQLFLTFHSPDSIGTTQKLFEIKKNLYQGTKLSSSDFEKLCTNQPVQ